jgi:hypothetical protein
MDGSIMGFPVDNMISPPASLEAQRTQRGVYFFPLPGDDGKGKIPVDS